MQPSKIMPGTVYAIQRGDNLIRFRVNEVHTITKRIGPTRTPHDSKSKVLGLFLDGDMAGQGEKTIDPDIIKGVYTEYKELIELKAKQDAEYKKTREVERKRALEDRLLLYAFIGAEPPSKEDDYSQFFRVAGYSNDLGINDKGIAALVAKIRSMQP